MGYSTRYQLTHQVIKPRPSTPCHPEAKGKKFCPECGQTQFASHDFVAKRLADLIRANEEASYCLNPDGSSEECGKWYQHSDDLKVWSKELPGVLLTLSCRGEDGRQWRVYAYENMIQEAEAKITFAPPTIVR